MKLLVVCSKNSGKIAPFVEEQVESLRCLGVEADYFTIEGKGVIGYLKSRKHLMNKIKSYKPDRIHAHFGLSGLLANLQRRVPVVTTYHGSDINCDNVFCFSKWSIRLSAYNIFVSSKNLDKARKYTKNYTLIPCGVDMEVFFPIDKSEARQELGLPPEKKLLLFSSSFANKVKNPELALEAVRQLTDAELIELAGYSRPQVALLMNAVDACLMTSHTEGSPQFIKEAMACNCPVVSVDVGDVADTIDEVDNCFTAQYDATDIARKLNFILSTNHRSNGRDKIISMNLDKKIIAQRLMEVYKSVSKRLI